MLSLKHAFVASAVLATGIAAIAIPTSASAVSVTYQDYSAAQTIDNSFIPSRIYWTENTKVYLKDGTDTDFGSAIMINDISSYGDSSLPKLKLTNNDQTIGILITGSTATDKKGNPVDILLTAYNLHQWKDGGFLALQLENKARGAFKNGSDFDQNEVIVKAGDPFIFWVESTCADGEFMVKYYKQGTTQSADIDRVAFTAWDFDVAPSGDDEIDYNAQYFKGYEGITPLTGNNRIFYKKNGGELKTEGNSIYLNQLEEGHTAGTHGFYAGNSIYALVTDLTYGAYTYRYSSERAGVAMAFGSIYNYDNEAPIKKITENDNIDVNGTIKDWDKVVDKNRKTDGDSYYYILAQTIPFNLIRDTATNSLLYRSVYDLNPEAYQIATGTVTGMTVSDTLDERLTWLSEKTFEYNLTIGGDTYKLAVAFDEATNKVTVTYPTALLQDTRAMRNTYYLTFPVKIKDNVDGGEIKNSANTTFTTTISAGGSLRQNRPSNEVTTTLYKTLTVRHINKDTGEELVGTVVTEHAYGDEYETNKLENLPDGLQLIEVPENAKGTLTKSTVVTYYYSKIKNPKTFDVNMIPFIGAAVATASVAGGLFFFVSKRR